MRSRVWMMIAVGVILLSAAIGLALLALGREPPVTPTATPTVTRPPTVEIPPQRSPTAAPPPTTVPQVYTIQDGDTLAGIALEHGISLQELVDANGLSDPDLIHPGQTLVIPSPSAVDAPSPPPATSPPGPTFTPLPAPTPLLPPVIEIAGVLGAGDLGRERVRVRNRGGMASLEGWTLSDATGNRYVFPRLVLFQGAEIFIHSAAGQSLPTELYWGRDQPAWDAGELIVLRDSADEVVDTYIVP